MAEELILPLEVMQEQERKHPQAAPLTPEEKEIFNLEFSRMLEIQLKERTLIEKVARHMPYIYETAVLAKEAFNRIKFGGLYPAPEEFGWRILTPRDLLPRIPADKRTAAGFTTIYLWERNITTVGWKAFLGDIGVPVKLDKNQYIVVFGWVNYVPAPKSIAIKLWLAGTELNVVPLMYQQTLYDVKLVDVIKPFRVPPEGEFVVRVEDGYTGLDALAPLAIIYAPQAYLKAETGAPSV